MKIQTFSVVVGGRKCNATCPYCVSKMTEGISACSKSPDDINVRNFRKACLFAKQSGVSTVLLTGVGEPLLYSSHIYKYLELLREFEFPFIELQTNGIDLHRFDGEYLKMWYDLGLTTVSLSVAHWRTRENREIFGENFVTLENNIEILHRNKLSVRISCVMLDGYIDSKDKILEMIQFCKDLRVEQLTCRPVGMPKDSKNEDIKHWAIQHLIDKDVEKDIDYHFNTNSNSTLLLKLAHGAKVYDYDGQNISLNSCLTHSPNPDDIRQLIFANDNHLRYSWEHKGAIIF